MNTRLLLDDGWTAERVAEALFIDAETVRAHRRLYASGGRAGVERLAYVGHAPVLSQRQAAELSYQRPLTLTRDQAARPLVCLCFGV